MPGGSLLRSPLILKRNGLAGAMARRLRLEEPLRRPEGDERNFLGWTASPGTMPSPRQNPPITLVLNF